MEQIKALTDTY